MGVLGRIFGTGEVVEKGLDLIESWTTNKDDLEEVRTNTKAKTDLLNAYAPFKIAQRVLAFAFCGVFLFSFVVCLGVVLYEFFTSGAAAAVAAATEGGNSANIVTAIKSLMAAFKIEWAVLAIVSFYFGGGALEGYQDKRTKREEAKQRAADNGHRPQTPR